MWIMLVKHAGVSFLPTGVFDLSSYPIFNNFGQYSFFTTVKKSRKKCKKTPREKINSHCPFWCPSEPPRSWFVMENTMSPLLETQFSFSCLED